MHQEVAVKNLIFDLGGVILDLSVDHTLDSFSKLSGIDKTEVQRLYYSSPGFEEYEKGAIDDTDFRKFVREVYVLKASDAEIDSCWNGMLRGIPLLKLQLLQTLKEKYRVFLLSNTNAIHLDYINTVLLPMTSEGKSLDDFFHKAYYSHRMLMRKPDTEIFQTVLNENKLVANETLFLDDNASNVEGASRLGIRTVLVTYPDLILSYFNA